MLDQAAGRIAFRGEQVCAIGGLLVVLVPDVRLLLVHHLRR
ncbi:hypothetical protein [Polymorphospora rubra]